jgi:CRP-like cAMP-binding protein
MPNTAKGSFDPKGFLAEVGEGKAIVRFDSNQIVFAQGTVADKVFYIQKGKIKVLVVSEQGKEAVVGILGPGQFFGEGCLHGQSQRTTTTKTLDECLITSITKEAMLTTFEASQSLRRCS